MPPQSADPGDHLSPDEIVLALQALSAADTRRARRWGQRLTNNLPGWTGDDLFQEAEIKFLIGDRHWKRGTPAFTSLAFAMRSIADNIRELADSKAVNPNVLVDETDPAENGEAGQLSLNASPVEMRTPLSVLEAKDELAALWKTLAGDENVELVAMAWMEGLRGKEATEATGLDDKTYDAARNRLRRKLDEFSASEEKS